ncbi:MAG TPA: c-type cytochrome biogenesis protein CcsB [Syntrophales bacterium]|nr:c-type cytochrome biogenesis protein CcsB [Syntrophales bacterium]
MINTVILSWVTFIYLAAFVLYLIRTIRGKEFWGSLASITLFIGLAAQTAALILRWIESYRMGIGHAPLSNFYESLIFFAWTVVLLYLVFEWRIKNKSLGAFVVPIAFLAMAFASLSPNMNSRIQPLIPALQSNWLTSHVVTCFMGYAAFTIACGFGIMYFIKGLDRHAGSHPASMLRFLPSRGILDELIYQSAALGFVFLTLGIITGSVWAHNAWGSYWSWDPKETWSLITWLVYAAMLHTRLVREWRGKRMALMAVIGFACVLFTYLGVNYLPGLHSYLKS